ncbi:hypothetical protein [Halalkalicoccus salilacus]|uniref:hypothetical protein n=1 Tax=Halalkalicoccus salilacus TaxID=3117459 RepID=UPI0038D3A176
MVDPKAATTKTPTTTRGAVISPFGIPSATAEVTTLVSRDLSPSVEIVARAEQMENVTKIYRADADYVLSLATVSGRMLATTVIEDEEVISLNTQIEVVRTLASQLAGQRIEDARIQSRTGCTVVSAVALWLD